MAQFTSTVGIAGTERHRRKSRAAQWYRRNRCIILFAIGAAVFIVAMAWNIMNGEVVKRSACAWAEQQAAISQSQES